MKEDDTRDITIRNEADIVNLREKLDGIDVYLKKHVKGIYAFLILISAYLLTSGIVKTEDIKGLLALIVK